MSDLMKCRIRVGSCTKLVFSKEVAKLLGWKSGDKLILDVPMLPVKNPGLMIRKKD